MMLSFYRALAGAWERITRIILRIAVSPLTVWVLVSLLFAVALVGALLPQWNSTSPAEIAYQEQIFAGVRERLGAGADILGSLGLLHIYQSRFLRALAAAVAAVAFLRLTLLWVPSWDAGPGRRASALTLDLAGDAREGWERLARAMSDAGQRLSRPVDADGAHHGMAWRAGPWRWLAGGFYLGILLLLLASVVAWRYGWVGPRLELALGESRSLDGQEGLTARLEQITFFPRYDHKLPRLESVVSLLKGDQVQGAFVLQPGHPATYDGFTLYQLGYGPAGRISARSAQGVPLSLQRMGADGSRQDQVRVRFAAQQQEQLLAIPEANVVLRLVYYPDLPTQGLRGQALHVQLRRGTDGGLLAERFLTEDGVITVGNVGGTAQGLEVRIAFEYYVLLRAEREPELPFAFLGALSALLGIAVMTFRPRREMWLTLSGGPRSCTCRLVLSRRDASSPWCQQLVARLQPAAENSPERGHDA